MNEIRRKLHLRTSSFLHFDGNGESRLNYENISYSNFSQKIKKRNACSIIAFKIVIGYKMIAIRPPEPSLIILSNVSFSLNLAFSGIRDSFA